MAHPPTAEKVRGLAHELAAAGFGAAEVVSAEPRPWFAWPKDWLRSALMPEAPRIIVGSTRAARDLHRLEQAAPGAATLFRLLVLGEPVDDARMQAAVPVSLRERLTAAAIASCQGSEWRAGFRVVPLNGAFIVTDFVRSRPSLGAAYVQLGLDSAMLADMILREGGSGERALDLCTGGGVQAVMLSRTFAHVDATDINPRAIQMARANAAVNGVDNVLHLSLSNLYDEARGPYDLIVANPPFVFMPPELAAANLTGAGGELGIDITMRILEGLEPRLTPGGRAFVYTQAPTMEGACKLVEAVAARLSGVPLHFEFEEILRGYWSPYRAFYKRMRVEWITCYRIRVRRSAAFDIDVRSVRGWRRSVLSLAVAVERWAPV